MKDTCRRKRKKGRFTAKCILWMLGIFCISMPAFASGITKISDFQGFYLCGVPDPGEYGNPEVFSLYFNEEGNLVRDSGVFYATLGSSTRYEYTDVSLKGDTLTCQYDRGYGIYEIRDGGQPGMHTFTLREDGNIESDGEIWYRYEAQDAETDLESGVLRTVRDVDFPAGDFSKNASFLGVERVKRSQIGTVTFLDTLEDVPDGAWDVSAVQDGSVRLWTDVAGGDVFIAAEGGVKANPDSGDLFRECTHLNTVNFSGNFDVSNATDFSYMFCGCSALTDLDGTEDWNTAKVSDMRAMFRGCSVLQSLDANFLTVDNVTNMSEIFRDCSELENLNAKEWHYYSALTADDAFAGTKWEDSSPLLETKSASISVGCILNTEILEDRPRLRAQLLMAYDDILADYWKNPAFYCLKDLNGDRIPEMVVRENMEDETYTFTVYVFNPVSCSANAAGETVASNWPELYWYPQEQVLNYDRGGEQGGIAIEKSRAYTILQYEPPETGREGLNFTYTQWEKIGSNECLITDAQTGEATRKPVSIYASKNGSGNYNYIAIYVDGHKVYRKELDGTRPEIEKDIFWLPGENEERIYYIYLHVGAENSSEYTTLLEYKDDTFEEVFQVEDVIEKEQLFGENYFKISQINGSRMVMTFFVNTYALGRELEFSIDFGRYSYGIKQLTYVADIEHTWSQSCNVTANENFDAYTTVRGDKAAFSVNKGGVVQYDKIWLSEGMLWIRIKNESGKKGWIPAGNEPVFDELSVYAKDEEEDWETSLAYRQQHFEIKIPENSELYELGRMYDEMDECDTAAVYYELIDSDSEHYEEVQEYLRAWEAYQNGEDGVSENGSVDNSEVSTENASMDDSGDTPENEPEIISEDDFGDTEEPERTDAFRELDVYSEYLQENWLDRDASCQSLDLDNDGEEELLIRYDSSDANCEIYKADAASGEVRYLGQLPNVQNALYWSEKYEALVQFSSSAGRETYDFYRFDNGTPEFAFGVSWGEVNNVDKRITSYSYFSNGENQEIGRYEVSQMEEEDPQAKAEASKKYREYLENMVLIEFSPILDFIWEYESGAGKEEAGDGSISEDTNGAEAGGSIPGNEMSEEMPTESVDSDYVIPDSNSRYLGVQEVSSLDPEEVRLSINELYARHGRVFTTPEIAAYFAAKTWYHPDASKTDEQIVAEFNEYEKANMDLLLKYQANKQ